MQGAGRRGRKAASVSRCFWHEDQGMVTMNGERALCLRRLTETVGLRRIFVRLQGVEPAHSEVCVRASTTPKTGKKTRKMV